MELVKAKKDLLLFSFLLLLIAGLKYAVGDRANVLVLKADAFHSISDFIGYLSLLFTVSVIAKKNEKFPYGLYKLESFTTLLISIFIGYNAFEILTSAEPQSIHSITAILVALFSSLVSLTISYFQEKLGKETRLKSVEVFAKEQRSDSLASLLIATSIGFSKKFPFLPYIMSIIITLLILKAAFEGLVDSLKSLLDMEPSDAKKEIEQKLKGFEILELKVRKAGPCNFVEATLPVSKDTNALEFENLSARIKNKLGSLVCYASIIPKISYQEEVLAVPLKNNSIASQFSGATEYLIVNGSSKKKYANKYLNKQVRRGAAIANWLAKQGVTAVLAKNIGTIAYSAFKGNGIRIYKATDDALEKLLEKFKNNQLKKIEMPTRVKL